MKVGDLVKEKDYPEVGIILEKNAKSENFTYKVYCLDLMQWWPREYIENDCEVVSESR